MSEVVAKRLVESTTNNKMCQNLISKVQAQLNHARVVVRTRVNQIKDLEDRIIKYSGMPKGGSVTKKLLEDKDTKTKSLRLSMNNLD